MPALLDALVAHVAANPLEAVAALVSVVSIWLSTREHIVSWPTAIVAVALYFIVFLRARFYAGMGLQVIFLALSVYGWYQWRFGGAERSELRVSRTPARLALLLAAVGAGAAVLLGLLLSRTTDATLPWLDSALAAASLVAQWMMTRKLLENWLLWVVIDCCYAAMYASQRLPVTAALYALLVLVAAKGHVDWLRSWRARASS